MSKYKNIEKLSHFYQLLPILFVKDLEKEINFYEPQRPSARRLRRRDECASQKGEGATAPSSDVQHSLAEAQKERAASPGAAEVALGCRASSALRFCAEFFTRRFTIEDLRKPAAASGGRGFVTGHMSIVTC